MEGEQTVVNQESMGQASNDGQTSRKRGKSRGLGLAKLCKASRNGKLPVLIPENIGVPVDQYASKFTSELSYLVHQYAPLDVNKWSLIQDSVKNKIYEGMQKKFVFENTPKIRSCILKHANKLYREWRHQLHLHHYLEYETDAQRRENKPEGVSVADWDKLLEYFGSETYKKISERNKRNREKEGVTQVTGRKSFQSIIYASRDPVTGEEPDGPELWRMTHQRHNGTWGDERSKNLHEKMVSLLNEPQPTSDGDTVVELTPNEAFRRVVGERSGHCRGYGFGPRGSLSSTKKDAQEREERLIQENREMARRMSQLEETFDARVDARVQAAMEAFLEKYTGSQQGSQTSTSTSTERP